MSDYHILSGDRYGNSYTVVMHIPIPDQANAVGVNYRVALVQMLGDTTSSVPFIDAGEQTQLDNGELVEHSEKFNTNPGLSLAQNRDAIDILYSSRVSQVQNYYANLLAYWGFNRDVP